MTGPALPGVPRWVATDSTGLVIATLTSLVPAGPLRRTMGRYESQTFTLTVDPRTDPAWLFATTPMQGALIAYTGDPGQEVVEWGGIITRRKRSLGNTVELSAATPECYLDRRFTGDYSVTGRDQNLILSDLVTIATQGDPAVPGSTGWPYRVDILGGAGTARDRSYADKDDKTLYSAIDELAHVDDPPQWATGWEWTHAPEQIRPVVHIGTRIGAAKLPGTSAPVTFTPTMMTDGSLDEDYASGRGANLVTAVSSGSGETRPQSSDGILQPHRPVVEDRFTPSTSITNVATLASHATEKLATEANGTQSLSFSVARQSAPRLGVDWHLGDDIDVILDGPTFPAPILTTGQCIGVDISADGLTPYLSTEEGF